MTTKHGARLHLQDLTKHYGSVVAVNKINLQVEAGEFLTLLGPSGSGKTTTLAMIGGFQEPTSGEIYVNDAPISGLPPYKRHLGVVFQNYALFPHMTVYDNIAFPLKFNPVPKAEVTSRVRRMLDIVQLPGYEKRYPRQLSGGQQQRIALARALVFNPSVLLMDEPLGALDKKLREEMQLEIRRLHQELEVTIIYVTHDQEEALTMSDRIAVMSHGRIEQLGTPMDVYKRPATAFVASFIGESNFFRGLVTDVNDHELVLRTNNGLLLRAERINGVRPGLETQVVVRPERPVFLAEGENLPNMVQGIVEEIIFIGHTLRYHIRLNDNQLLVIRKQEVPYNVNVQIHAQVRVGWLIEDCITLHPRAEGTGNTEAQG